MLGTNGNPESREAKMPGSIPLAPKKRKPRRLKSTLESTLGWGAFSCIFPGSPKELAKKMESWIRTSNRTSGFRALWNLNLKPHECRIGIHLKESNHL